MQVTAAIRADAHNEGLSLMDIMSNPYYNAALVGVHVQKAGQLRKTQNLVHAGDCGIRTAAHKEGLSSMDIVSKPYHDAALTGAHVSRRQIRLLSS